MSIFTRIKNAVSTPAAPVAVASKPKAARKPVNSEAGVIRAWARENGIEVGERGRISAEVREAYAAQK